eukprot:TRINITY_DN42258_c0_g1_i1.p1 TRINITY_DN42258_c0_g1~~TRINITY_DN42258_c0_g1_i1.p1  ORF type:complete len:206 (-),score=18.35 TRINITY_DN42258_c0_g1_i1:224-775(-)
MTCKTALALCFCFALLATDRCGPGAAALRSVGAKTGENLQKFRDLMRKFGSATDPGDGFDTFDVYRCDKEDNLGKYQPYQDRLNYGSWSWLKQGCFNYGTHVRHLVLKVPHTLIIDGFDQYCRCDDLECNRPLLKGSPEACHKEFGWNAALNYVWIHFKLPKVEVLTDEIIKPEAVDAIEAKI